MFIYENQCTGLPTNKGNLGTIRESQGEIIDLVKNYVKSGNFFFFKMF